MKRFVLHFGFIIKKVTERKLYDKNEIPVKCSCIKKNVYYVWPLRKKSFFESQKMWPLSSGGP